MKPYFSFFLIVLYSISFSQKISTKQFENIDFDKMDNLVQYLSSEIPKIYDEKDQPVTAIELQRKVGNMNSLWETHEKLPEGWRYGGWRKLNHEPMDIEPIGGKVWGNKGANNLVSYRSSPFTIRSGTTTTTVTKQGFQNCPSGLSPDPGWPPLCIQAGTWRRTASNQEINNNRCSTPVNGGDPISGARDPNGIPKSDEHYNMSRTSLKNEGTKWRPLWNCVQTGYAEARPWGEVTEIITTTGPIDNNYPVDIYYSNNNFIIYFISIYYYYNIIYLSLKYPLNL